MGKVRAHLVEQWKHTAQHGCPLAACPFVLLHGGGSASTQSAPSVSLCLHGGAPLCSQDLVSPPEVLGHKEHLKCIIIAS